MKPMITIQTKRHCAAISPKWADVRYAGDLGWTLRCLQPPNCARRSIIWSADDDLAGLRADLAAAWRVMEDGRSPTAASGRPQKTHCRGRRTPAPLAEPPAGKSRPVTSTYGEDHRHQQSNILKLHPHADDTPCYGVARKRRAPNRGGTARPIRQDCMDDVVPGGAGHVLPVEAINFLGIPTLPF